MRTASIMLLVLLLSLTNFLDAKTIKVPQDYSKIQLAINAAVNGDTVLVAEGTYFENLVVTKKITLASLYLIDQDTSHISKTIIDGGTPSRPDSASVILVLPGTDTTTVIKGFTIQNGKGTAITLGGTYPYIGGGGIEIIAGGATISTNMIKYNSSQNPAGYSDGGGITVHPNPETNIAPIPWIIENNTITGNTVTSRDGSDGGGLTLTGRGRVVNNVIKNNTSSGQAGGVAIYGLLGEQNIEFSNNLVTSNSAASFGGGIGMWVTLGPPMVILRNNIIVNNSCSKLGGAIGVESGSYLFINNTIAGNSSPQAIYLSAPSGSLAFRLLNNIIWNPGAGQEFNTTTNVSSAYNCVRSGLTGTGNINADPLFVVNDSLYHLTNSSPAIGAGVSSASLGGVTLNAPLFDYFNTPRPRASGSNPDMGAVENDRSSPFTSVKEIVNGIPTSFGLDQNYPNPFNPTTVISYRLPVISKVTLKIYDVLGREVATMVNEEQSAGWKEVQWNAKDVSSGIYFYKLQALQKDGGRAGSFVETKKMLVVK